MIETTYTCDKCGHSQQSGDQMWKVGILLRHLPNERSYYNLQPEPENLWCRSCVTEVGLIPPSRQELPPPPALTLEDLVREIVKEELR